MAATKLNVDVSTVSRQLKDLEIRLGLRLCERGRSGFSLTMEGETVYRLTCDLLRTIEDFEDRINEVRDRAVGQLRIGAINHVLTNDEINFGGVIRRINEKAPDLDVGYNVMSSPEICRAVLNGHIHIGITAHDREHPELERFVVYIEKHHLFCGRGHLFYDMSDAQLKQANLNEQKYVAREHRSPTDEVAEGLGLIRGAVANDIEAITVLVESGLYLGYLPSHHVTTLPSERSLRAINIKHPATDVPLYLYHRKGARRLSTVRMFLDEMKIEKT
jgi:LysR family transcriptional regulator, transcriptional activator for bauABCD operon